MRAFADDIRDVNAAMAAVRAGIPTIDALAGMDFATGGARTISTAIPSSGSVAAPATAPTLRAPAVLGGAYPELLGQRAPQKVVNQVNHITVPASDDVARQIDHDLRFLVP